MRDRRIGRQLPTAAVQLGERESVAGWRDKSWVETSKNRPQNKCAAETKVDDGMTKTQE